MIIKKFIVAAFSVLMLAGTLKAQNETSINNWRSDFYNINSKQGTIVGKSNLQQQREANLAEDIAINSSPDSTNIYQYTSGTDSSLVERAYYSYTDEKELEGILKYHYDSFYEQIKKSDSIVYSGSKNDRMTTTYKWNVKKESWFNYAKNEIGYDELGNWNLTADYLYDSLKEKWIPQVKMEFTYEKNRQTSFSYYEWNGERNILEGKYKDTYTLNADSSFHERFEYQWNSTEENWQYNLKTEYEYPDPSTIISYYYFWEAENWKLDKIMKEETFKENSVKSRITSDWNPDQEIWIFVKKYEEEYDNNGNLVLTLTSRYNPETMIWYYSYKQIFEYNSDNNQTFRENSIYNLEQQLWQPSIRSVNVYDKNGFLSGQTSESWIEEKKAWRGNLKTDNYWYLSGDQRYWIHHTEYKWDNTEMEWKIDTREFKYYSDLITGIGDQPKSNLVISIYPNPSQNKVVVDAPKFTVIKLQLYDNLGREWPIHHQAHTNKLALDLSNIPVGTYILRIHTRQGVETRKIVKN